MAPRDQRARRGDRSTSSSATSSGGLPAADSTGSTSSSPAALTAALGRGPGVAATDPRATVRARRARPHRRLTQGKLRKRSPRFVALAASPSSGVTRRSPARSAASSCAVIDLVRVPRLARGDIAMKPIGTSEPALSSKVMNKAPPSL